MSKPPFVMSQYASREDLLADAASYYEAECEALRTDNATLRAALKSHGEEAAKLVENRAAIPVLYACTKCGGANYGCKCEGLNDCTIPLYDNRAAIDELVGALKAADMFITNGVALGFIRMPDADCPDPAHATHGIIRAAITKHDTSSTTTTKEEN